MWPHASVTMIRRRGPSRSTGACSAATDAALASTIAADHLDYLPCSLFQPNVDNRCTDPEDANWTSPLNIWAWEGSLLGAPESGPPLTMIGATYEYGFDRLRGTLPPGPTGGFAPDLLLPASTTPPRASAGLAAPEPDFRDQGIVDYEFMISHTQSGPYSWWESVSPPAPSPWVGTHPAGGQGSSPHAWGLAGADKVLLDSLVAQRTDGDLVVGRGVPPSWIRPGATVSVTNFPTTDGHRVAVEVHLRLQSRPRPALDLHLRRLDPRRSDPPRAPLVRPRRGVHERRQRRRGHRDGHHGAVRASGHRRASIAPVRILNRRRSRRPGPLRPCP